MNTIEKTLKDLFNLDSEIAVPVKESMGAPEPQSWYMFDYGVTVRTIDYLEHPTGRPLLVEGPERSGKSTFPREMAARLGMEFFYLSGSNDLSVEAMLYQAQAVIKAKGMVHLDHAQVIQSQALKRMADALSQNGVHFVVSADGDKRLNPLVNCDKITLMELSSSLVTMSMHKYLDRYDLSENDKVKAEKVIETISEINQALGDHPFGVEFANQWLNEVLLMLRWGMVVKDPFIEALSALECNVTPEFYEDVCVTADFVIRKKFDAAA
ncbi:hypothetical protein [Vibrio mediterranei]|uniref:hypothetical protein n=1 Tax=Vibrio mediterranei TaxID=689 RepID=UPI0040680807